MNVSHSEKLSIFQLYTRSIHFHSSSHRPWGHKLRVLLLGIIANILAALSLLFHLTCSYPTPGWLRLLSSNMTSVRGLKLSRVRWLERGSFCTKSSFIEFEEREKFSVECLLLPALLLFLPGFSFCLSSKISSIKSALLITFFLSGLRSKVRLPRMGNGKSNRPQLKRCTNPDIIEE